MHADLLTKPAALAPRPPQRALPLAALAAEHSPRTTCLLSLAGAAMCRRGAARRPLQLPHPCPAHAAPDQPPSLVAGERRTVRERADSDALDVSSPHVHATRTPRNPLQVLAKDARVRRARGHAAPRNAWGRSRLRHNDEHLIARDLGGRRCSQSSEYFLLTIFLGFSGLLSLSIPDLVLCLLWC